MKNHEAHLPIKNWAEQDRPREKMILKGKNALSDAELLAILINTGTVNKSALDIARDVLAQVNQNLHELGNLDVKDLKKAKGMGEAKAITIAAALELGRRRLSHMQAERQLVNSSALAFYILNPYLENQPSESFYALFLNKKMELLGIQNIGVGGIDFVTVDIRVIFKHALAYSATSIIVAHNHPSGNLKPSNPDLQITEKIKQAGKVLEITLIDHLIIGGSKFLSLADEGYF